jgi:uncharacterized membrane protein
MGYAGMNDMILSEVFGFIAIPLSVWRYQLSSRHAILFSLIPTGIIVIASYYFGHEYQGAIMVLFSIMIAVVQGVLGLGSQKDSRVFHHLRWFLAVLAIIFGFIFEPPVSLVTTIPFIAFVTAKWADHFLDVYKLRRYILIATILWGIYAGITENYLIMLLEIFTLASNLIWLRRNTGEAAVTNGCANAESL